jgi:outer membrane protein TolC
VKVAFFGVQAARALFDSAKAAYERARKHRDMVVAAVKNGMRPTIDLTREEAGLVRFEVELENALGSLTLTESELAAAIGSVEPGIDTPPVDEAVELSVWPASLDEIFEREPRLQAARARLRAQQARTRAMFAEMLPTLAFSGAFSGREGGAAPTSGASGRYLGLVPSVPNWDVGLVLSWPVYDQANVARYRVSKASEQTIEADFLVMVSTERARLQKAFGQVEVYHRAIPAFRRALDAAKENYSQADARFRAGLGTTIELADAESLLTMAEDHMIIGRLQWARAKAAFDRLLARSEAP